MKSRPTLAASAFFRAAAHPSKWRIWSLRKPAIAWLLSVDILAVALLIIVVSRQGTPAVRDWVLFAAFATCSTAHMVITKRAEERRRAAHLSGKPEHIDQTSIWLFSAAILLPMGLVIVLVGLVRVQRYLIARKQPATFLTTSLVHMLSALGAHLVARSTPLAQWPAARVMVPSVGSLLLLAVSIVAAVVTYFVVQAVLVGISRSLLTRNWSLGNMLGSPADNWLEVNTLLIGVFAAVVGSFAPPALLAVAAVATYSTLAEQRLYQLQQDREKLEVDALHDALTGLPNRRGFEPQATLAMMAAEADELASAVLMADLDHFKNWNTTLGHFGADQVLTAVAGVLRSNTRKTDLLCRWGGEELAIVMPNTKREEAAVLAERLRAAVEDLRIEVTKPAGGQPRTVAGITVSIGVAMMPQMGSSLAAAQEAADHALQAAKDNGRNQVRFAGPTLSPPLSA